MVLCIKLELFVKHPPLTAGRIIKRYKRFLADIILDQTGEEITAHVANTGKMTSCWEPEQKVLLSYHDNPKRKLKYSLELVHNGISWINVNTHLANKLVIEAIENGTIKEIGPYQNIRSEYKIGDSRIDLFIEQKDKNCLLEIKSVTLNIDGTAQFPDTITTRGQKHITELIKIKKNGDRAILFFLVQREDVNCFKIAQHLDPVYAELLSQAILQGVEVLIYQCKITPEEIKIILPLPWSS